MVRGKCCFLGEREKQVAEGDSEVRMSRVLCRHGGLGVRMSPGFWPDSLVDYLGEVPGSQFLPIHGRHLPAYFPPYVHLQFLCPEFSSSPSGHLEGRGLGRRSPTSAAGPQGRGCPWPTRFLFLEGGHARASQTWGPLFPRPHGLRGQGSPGLPWGVWGASIPVIRTRVHVTLGVCLAHLSASVWVHSFVCP